MCASMRDRVTVESAISIAACVCVCERERDRVISQQSVQPVRNRLNRCLFANTYEHHHCICHVTLFPSQVWTDGKTKDIINWLYFNFESWSTRLGKGHYISDAACGVRPITMHCASWPIRADCACRKEGLCRKLQKWFSQEQWEIFSLLLLD